MPKSGKSKPQVDGLPIFRKRRYGRPLRVKRSRWAVFVARHQISPFGTGSPRICFANPCFAAGLRPLRAALENAHAFSQLRTLPGSIPVARHVNENGSGPHKEPKPLKLSYGAGDGNRTRVISLEGWGSTIELRPQDMVGTTGFEPATSCSQSRRATKLRHVPKVLSS